jgi:hypothetical protein
MIIFPHEVNLQFMASTVWFNTVAFGSSFTLNKFSGKSVGSDALAAEHFSGILENILKNMNIQANDV